MPDDSLDPQIRVGATIDATGATAGARQVVQGVNEIEGATGKAAEGANKLVENLGSMRSAHHAIAGIGEIARGGTAELAGMAMEARFVTEAFEAMPSVVNCSTSFTRWWKSTPRCVINSKC